MGDIKFNLSLGPCLVGKNLNTIAIRGNASLGLLASISHADKYDQFSNEAGVQRSPAEKHAREALAYALEASSVDPFSDPRAFTEVILNGRDTSPFVFRDLLSKQELTAENVLTGKYSIVDVSINVAKLDLTPFKEHLDIQISRVDGNHRLLMAQRIVEQGDLSEEEFPIVPFSLFLGLTPEQERKIFVDINGNHKNMSKSLLINFQTKRNLDSDRASSEDLASWIAMRLSDREMAFGGMVNLGGDLTGYRLRHNTRPPLTLVGITNAMKDFVAASAYTRFNNPDSPALLLRIVNDFFIALRDQFPDGFERHHEYVFLKALGLTTFAKLAGTVYSNVDVSMENYSPDLGQRCVKVLLESLDFGKFKWSGYSSRSGMTVLFMRMQKALDEAGMHEYSRVRSAI
ncbi:MAG: DNA-sulfur modification-associated [Actinomycetota bacterium]|jgi:DGQHR domain-containing protein